MEVTVVRLRRHGANIPRERLDSEARQRGHLSIYYWHLKNHREERKVKELVLKSDPKATCQPVMRLEAPDQTQLEGMDMVYVGIERVDGVEYRQAWWVKAEAQSRRA